MLYHRIYHHSLELHMNHLMFLHTYLFGIYFIVASADQIIILAAVAGLFGLYVCLLGRSILLWMVPYLIFAVGGLPFGAWSLHLMLSQQWGWPCWGQLALGASVVLASFSCQLLGHWLHELFNAPPSLMHGFLAAPVLEYISLLWRLGVTKGDRDAILREADACRERGFCLHRDLILRQIDD